MPSVLCSDGIGRWREARSCGHNVAAVIRMHDAWDHWVASGALGREGMGWDGMLILGTTQLTAESSIAFAC